MNFNLKSISNLFSKKSSGTETNLTLGDLGRWMSAGLGEDLTAAEYRYPIWRFPTVAKIAFEQNVVVYKSVMLRSSAVAGLTWNLYTTKNGERQEIKDRNHPLLKLIKSPNPAQGQATFIQHVEASRLMDGNVFMQMVNSADTSGFASFKKKPPRELWVLRPDWVQVIPGANGERLPAEYVYMPGGVSQGKYQVFPVDPITGDSELIHIASYSPLIEDIQLRGLSPIRTAILQILTHNAGQRWNHRLLNNSARPSGAFTTDGGKDSMSDLTESQLKDLRQQLAEIYGSPENAGRPLVLPGGLAWQEMSMTPTDADWLNLKNSAARDIANVIGVPSQLLGIPGDNTYSNYQEARQSFYQDTVIPTAKQLRDELNRRLVPLFGDNIWLDIDEDDIPALAALRDAKRKAISEATFLTINEKREAMGYEHIGPEGDEILVPANVVPLTLSISLGDEKNPDVSDGAGAEE